MAVFLLTTVYCLLLSNHAASDTPPPCRLVETGAHAGPLCLRPLNQNAVIHTFAPAGNVLGKGTNPLVFPVFPSNCQAPMSAGGVAPTKVKIDAPGTPGGLPRRVPDVVSCSLIFTVHPLTEMISSPGASAGGGIGVGAERTFNPSASFWASVTLAVPCTRRSRSLASALRLVRARFFVA